ncbi:MAG: PH domain-containing protein [Solirubrobacterales bacterium]|nr:PH domain-containing protein [Solirubrobacterales bacterium]
MAFTPSPGEQIIFQGHPSWRAILAFYLKGIAIGIILAIIAKLVGASSALVFGIVLVALGLAVLIGFIKRMATTYTITNRRLNIKRGIFARDIQETRLERVQNVNFSQSVFQRMLQVGDVDFDTASSDNENEFVFNGVGDPQEVVTKVDKATSAGAAGDHGLGEPATATERSGRGTLARRAGAVRRFASRAQDVPAHCGTLIGRAPGRRDRSPLEPARSLKPWIVHGFRDLANL